MKNFTKSKRFWAGLIALLTSISFVFTGEKDFVEQLPFIITGAISFVQTVIGLVSTDKIIAGWN